VATSDPHDGTRKTLAFAQRSVLMIVDSALHAKASEPVALAAVQELRAAIEQHGRL